MKRKIILPAALVAAFCLWMWFSTPLITGLANMGTGLRGIPYGTPYPTPEKEARLSMWSYDAESLPMQTVRLISELPREEFSNEAAMSYLFVSEEHMYEVNGQMRPRAEGFNTAVEFSPLTMKEGLYRIYLVRRNAGDESVFCTYKFLMIRDGTADVGDWYSYSSYEDVYWQGPIDSSPIDIFKASYLSSPTVAGVLGKKGGVLGVQVAVPSKSEATYQALFVEITGRDGASRSYKLPGALDAFLPWDAFPLAEGDIIRLVSQYIYNGRYYSGEACFSVTLEGEMPMFTRFEPPRSDRPILSRPPKDVISTVDIIDYEDGVFALSGAAYRTSGVPDDYRVLVELTEADGSVALYDMPAIARPDHNALAGLANDVLGYYIDVELDEAPTSARIIMETTAGGHYLLKQYELNSRGNSYQKVLSPWERSDATLVANIDDAQPVSDSIHFVADFIGYQNGELVVMGAAYDEDISALRQKVFIEIEDRDGTVSTYKAFAEARPDHNEDGRLPSSFVGFHATFLYPSANPPVAIRLLLALPASTGTEFYELATYAYNTADREYLPVP